MRVAQGLAIVIGCFFLFATTGREELSTDPTGNFSPVMETNTSEGPSGELLEVLLRICTLVGKVNGPGLPADAAEQIKENISELLKKAVSFQSHEKVKDYFFALARDVLTDDFSESHSLWTELEGRTGNLILRQGQDRKKMECFVLGIHRHWTDRAARYLTLIEKMKANSTMKSNRTDLPVTVSYPIVVADVATTSGNHRLSLIHPPDLAEGESKPSRIIFFRNLARRYFDIILSPLAVRILGPATAGNVRFDAFMSNLIMHKIAHLLGPYTVGSKSEDLVTVASKLGDLFHCIEEIKADTVAMSNTEVLVAAKVISRKHDRRILATQIIQLLDKARSEPGEPNRLPSLIQIHYLLKNGGLVFNVDSQILMVDFNELKDNLEKLMFQVLKIQESGSPSAANRLIKDYGWVPAVMKRLQEKMTGVPVAIKPEQFLTLK